MSFHRSFGSFAKKMRFRAQEVALGTNATVKRVGLGVHQAVVIATPVDTGQARSNWFATLGLPTDETRGPLVPQGSIRSTSGPITFIRTVDRNAAAVIAEGKSIIESRKPNGGDIWLTNNLPYIQRLNQGYSAQAPAMFVQQAAAEAARIVANAKIFEAP